MPIIVDISEDKFLNEIFDAIEARREARGEAKAKTETTQRLLESGRFSLEEIADFVKVSLDFVLDIKEKLDKTAPKGKSTKK